jgi:hypothetical protein
MGDYNPVREAAKQGNSWGVYQASSEYQDDLAFVTSVWLWRAAQVALAIASGGASVEGSAAAVSVPGGAGGAMAGGGSLYAFAASPAGQEAIRKFSQLKEIGLRIAQAPIARGAEIVAPRLSAFSASAAPKVADPRLRNLVMDLYKGVLGQTPVGSGSTADAVRNELRTGLATHGTFHFDKAREYINALTNWLNQTSGAAAEDIAAARALIQDLTRALSGN